MFLAPSVPSNALLEPRGQAAHVRGLEVGPAGLQRWPERPGVSCLHVGPCAGISSGAPNQALRGPKAHSPQAKAGGWALQASQAPPQQKKVTDLCFKSSAPPRPTLWGQDTPVSVSAHQPLSHPPSRQRWGPTQPGPSGAAKAFLGAGPWAAVVVATGAAGP